MARPSRAVIDPPDETDDKTRLMQGRASLMQETRGILHSLDPNWPDLTLETRLGYIMGMVGNIPKSGYNNFHKYRYAMETDLVSAIRPLLAAAGIMIIPSIERHKIIDGAPAKDGTPSKDKLTVLTVRFSITDGRSEIIAYGIGYGSDTGDKGAYKAMTGALKYMLMKMFLIDTGDDPEADERTDRRASRLTEPEMRDVIISDHQEDGVGRGGHPSGITTLQTRRIIEVVRNKGIDRESFIFAINQMGLDFELSPEAKNPQIMGVIAEMTAAQAGQLIQDLEALVVETVEVPEPDDTPYA